MQNTCALANESPREFELTKGNFISHFSIGSKSAHDEFLGIPRTLEIHFARVTLAYSFCRLICLLVVQFDIICRPGVKRVIKI